MPQVMSQVATIFRYLFLVDISYYEYNVRPPSDVSWLTKAPVTIVIYVP